MADSGVTKTAAQLLAEAAVRAAQVRQAAVDASASAYATPPAPPPAPETP